MERVLGIALTASQAVIHVLLRDLTNYYYYKELVEINRLNTSALKELEPAKIREEFIPSTISYNKPEDKCGNVESKALTETGEEFIPCNKFISFENQENNRSKDIKGEILKNDDSSKSETTLLAQNGQDCYNSEINIGSNESESCNYLEERIDLFEDLETLDDEDENTQSYNNKTVNTASTPNSTTSEKTKISHYCFGEIFSKFNAPAKKEENMGEIEDYSSDRSSENIRYPSSEKDVDEKDESIFKREEKTSLDTVCPQSTECHSCIFENYLVSRWSSEENLDKLINDQCVPEVKDQTELNSSIFKDPIDKNNNIINENICRPLGVIEGFSDIESSCYDEEWVTRFIAEISGECVPINIEEIKTDESITFENEEDEVNSLKNETDLHESECNKTYRKTDENICDCCKVYCCLQVVDCDEEDELLTEEQLRSVETGSVSDWLYTVRPAGCWLSATNIIHVSLEELKRIDDKNKNQELEDTIIKKLFIHKWLENMSLYCDPSLKYACGDYEAK